MIEEQVFQKQGPFHAAAFNALAIFSVVGSGLVFVLALLGLDVEAWSFVVFVSSFFFMLVSTRVFLCAVSSHDKLYAGMKKGLNSQRRRNINLVNELETRKAIKHGAGMEQAKIMELIEASRALDLLVDYISDTRQPLRLCFGAFEMTNSTILKVAGVEIMLLMVTLVMTALRGE